MAKTGNRTTQRTRRRKQERRKRIAATEARIFRDRPVVTIFADASFHHQTKTGGWGAWIKADNRDALTKGGAFAGTIETSTEAEIRALANALALARAAGLAPNGGCVMLQSDCRGALCWILTMVQTACHRPAPGNAVEIRAHPKITANMRQSAGLKAIVEIAAAGELKLALRHVPGHKDGQGRAWVNRLVDKLAGAHRRPAKPQEASPDV